MIEPQADMQISWAVKLETILSWLQEQCGEAFLCGGAARKLLSSGALSPPTQGEILLPRIDDSLADNFRAAFPDIDCRTDNGVVHLNVATKEPEGIEIVLSAFRAEEPNGDAPATAPSAISDLRMRGVTILAFGIKAGGDVLDPFNGIEDLQQKTIRLVGNPRLVFREQPEMLLRIARHIAEYGYEPDSDTTRFASRDAANIMSVERAVWAEEMNKLLLCPDLDQGLEWLRTTGVLRFLLPEVVSLVDFHRSCAVHHKDCWDHTVQVTRKANADLCTKWAALCHDIGKIWTRSVDRNRQVHFYRHEEYGAILFEGIAARFHMDEVLAFRVASVIKLHGRVNLYESNWSDSAIRRLIRDSGEHLEDLIRFSKADFTSKRPERVATIRRQLEELEIRIAQIRTETLNRSPLPKGLGTALISELGVAPGPDLGHLRRGLEQLCETGEILTEQGPEYYIDQTRATGISAVIELGKKRHLQRQQS